MKCEFNWEVINNTETTETARAKVPGGWLVHVITINGKQSIGNMVFIADSGHQWNIIKPKPEMPPAPKASEGF